MMGKYQGLLDKPSGYLNDSEESAVIMTSATKVFLGFLSLEMDNKSSLING